MSGKGKSISYKGYLDGFFDCIACYDCTANILCEADVEDMFQMTIVQGVSKTVHMPDGDLVFKREGKFYMADMSDWMSTNVNLTTVTDRENLYTSKEINLAKEAWDFVKNAGYPSLKETIHMVNDGNVVGIQLSTKDVYRAYDIYGIPPAAIRGKQTKHKITRTEVDETLREQRTEQVLTTDVMKVCNQPYLISICEPLQLTITSNLQSEDAEQLGKALQVQFSLLRSRGFKPVRVYTDPQRGFLPLVGNMGGVEIDITGAGDHLDKVDAKIRRLKELIRSVHASLPWNLPASKVKDLISYATSRINTRRTSANSTNTAPRVAFTGRKVDMKEFAISFGEYCECTNPKAVSNDALEDRTEPCIALYPAANATGAWIFLNIKTNKYVRRTSYRKLPTSEIVIMRMNELAKSEKKKVSPEETEDVVPVTQAVEILKPVTHVVAEASQTPITTSEFEASEEHNETTDNTSEEHNEATDNIATDEHTMTGAIVQNDDTIEMESQNNNAAGNVEEEALQELVPDVQTVPIQQVERRSARFAAGRRMPSRYTLHTTVNKGIKLHGQTAINAIIAELKQLFVDKKALIPVLYRDLPRKLRRKILRSSMFLKEKYDARGLFEKIKARLVADGRGQDRKLYPNNKSPTVKVFSLMILLSIAARERLCMAKVDIGGAYLNAKMEGEEVIMRLDPLLTAIATKYLPELKPYEENGKMLVKLDKALYGCVQSAKLWYDTLIKRLHEMGFSPNEADPCVFNKMIRGKKCTLCIYVDDILILSKEKQAIDEVIDALKAGFDDVKVEQGEDISYLGMNIKLKHGSAEIDMKSFIADALKSYGPVKNASTPAAAKLFDNPGSEELSEDEAKSFHTHVMRLLYLGQRGRPDILLPILCLCTRVQRPTVADSKKLSRVFGYLQETKDQTLTLNCGDFNNIKVYIDAAFGIHADGKSHSGCAIYLGGACIWCSSRKQKIVTKDSTEAELVALQDMLLMVEQIQEFLIQQGVELNLPVIFQDNTSTITLVTQGGGKSRNKHLRARQAWVKERHDKKEIKIVHTGTHNMIADALTKPIQGELFRKYVRQIMGTKKIERATSTGAR